MPLRFTTVIVDAFIVLAGTFVAGFLVSVSLGEAERGSRLWGFSLMLMTAVVCIGCFFVLALLRENHRFAHLWMVATVSALPNLVQALISPAIPLWSVVGTLTFMLAYASVGGGIAVAVDHLKSKHREQA
jgi:hypothetical protein